MLIAVPAMLAATFGWLIWYFLFSPEALFGAAMHGDAAEVRAVLARGVPVDVPHLISHGTALMLAAHNPFPDTCRVLLDHGANANAATTFGTTALMLASAHGCADTVRLLLSRGADVNATNKYGHTALHSARRERHADIVAVLLEAGAK